MSSDFQSSLLTVFPMNLWNEIIENIHCKGSGSLAHCLVLAEVSQLAWNTKHWGLWNAKFMNGLWKLNVSMA